MSEPEPQPVECVDCRMPLPIAVGQSPHAKSLACAGCGSRYLGEVWPAIPENLKGNVRIVEE